MTFSGGEPRVAADGNTFIIRDDPPKKTDSVGKTARAIFAAFKKHTEGLSLKKYLKEVVEFQECHNHCRNPYHFNDPEGIRISRISEMVSRMLDSEIADVEAAIKRNKRNNRTNKC